MIFHPRLHTAWENYFYFTFRTSTVTIFRLAVIQIPSVWYLIFQPLLIVRSFSDVLFMACRKPIILIYITGVYAIKYCSPMYRHSNRTLHFLSRSFLFLTNTPTDFVTMTTFRGRLKNSMLGTFWCLCWLRLRRWGWGCRYASCLALHFFTRRYNCREKTIMLFEHFNLRSFLVMQTTKSSNC